MKACTFLSGISEGVHFLVEINERVHFLVGINERLHFLSGKSDCAHSLSGLSGGAHFLSATRSCVLYDVCTAYFLYFVCTYGKVRAHVYDRASPGIRV